MAVCVTDSNFCFINCDSNFYEVGVFLTEGLRGNLSLSSIWPSACLG